jgi:hypothetical protein
MTTADCRLIQLPKILDHRGSLSVVEGEIHVPFAIKRIYYLYDVPEGASRGGHGHRALEQLFIAVAGEFDVVVDDGYRQDRYRLTEPDEGLYVSAMMWRTVEQFTAGAMCMVVASTRYDEADYFREYEEFLTAAGVR